MPNLDVENLFSDLDKKMMSRALDLAHKGIYSTTPNPRVGCVIIDPAGTIIGEGFHQKAGEAHAEVAALNQAREKAQGACVYVTLEPCAHHGRTPPCAQALIDAKVKKVVVACTDPNPQVSAKGIEMLRAAGIEVLVGLLEKQALALNKAFMFRMQHNRPFISVKLAASLDGKTALSNGESKWITSAPARGDVQYHRASACAILSGADTVIADNPQLNVRANELSEEVAAQFAWRNKQPLRVLIDSKNRLQANKYQLFQDRQATLVYNTSFNDALSCDHDCVSQQQVSSKQMGTDLFVDLHCLFADLAKREINHVWVEAGASLSGALFEMGLVDELILYQAPKILGSSARALTNIRSKDLLNEAIQGKVLSVKTVGLDTKTIIEFSDN